ncbi:cis,cis-muconate lactonizing enzyme precursor [Cordyceps javanica]|uniref:Cis,cis-muconate lactonizing enzyme n=1 Tax=Cordyceps javanica TaxID=43265 RepID=A0A545VGK8_9HYPO|nr:cis,cis-muconate lactonizing enzyme precursor [Cordyceps javanica]TQW12047.1 cis,cis-muconate lactonizing enzyme precursor [Cordyceps javanica]
MELFVGAFNVPYIYTLFFDPLLAHLNVTHISNATASHPWISFAPDQKTLYGLSWVPPGVSAYRNQRGADDPFHALEFLNSKPVYRVPGYITSSDSYLYSVGGASGEVFRVESDGTLGDLAQQLDFSIEGRENATAPTGSFSLRNGTHGVELSPEGNTLYVSDLGANGVWTLAVSGADGQSGTVAAQKLYKAPADNEGLRHSKPHPNGKILYVIGEHSNTVDVFSVKKHRNGTVEDVKYLQNASVLPRGINATNYAAATVRISTGPPGFAPKYLFATTRGNNATFKGYVSVFELDSEGRLARTEAIDVWETPTHGGFSHALEPAPWVAAVSSGKPFLQYLALTDEVVGKVRVLTFDGTRIREVAAVTLEIPASDPKAVSKERVRAANAVWLHPVRCTA